MKLKDRVAIVTGGAGGIGKTVAETFCREGATVIIIGRNKRAISQALSDIKRKTDIAAQGMICDVSNYSAIQDIVKNIAKRFKKIDILVNCAGIQEPIGPFIVNDMKKWEKNIAVNLFGTVHMCKAVVPFMTRRRGGSIINFSGGGATSSRTNFSAYAVAKTGVVKFTEILAEELASSHIRVNAIAPGAVNTSMLAEILKVGVRAGKTELSAAKRRIKEGGIPPELTAELSVFLASSASMGLTGRLVSAPWDGWKKWTEKDVKKIMASDRLTLRRA